MALAWGAAGLVLETTWLRWFRPLFGATAPAVSASLVAFLAGGAIGAAWAARVLPGRARPLSAFGALSLAAALAALGVPLALRLAPALAGDAYARFADAPAALAAARFALALAATLPATLCLGASFPALAAAALPGAAALGTRGSALYALDLTGAACGASLAAFWLPYRIGVDATYGLGVGLLAAAGGAALARGRGVPPRPPARRPAVSDPARAGLLGLAALSGFGSLGAQVLLVQSLGQVLNQSVIAFGAVLVVALASLGGGAAAVSLSQRRAALDPERLLAGALAASALALAAFPALLFASSDGLRYAGSERPWPGYLWEALRLAGVSAGPSLLAVALVLPALFAVAGRRAGRRPTSAAAPLGRLWAASTAGGIAGALAAPFVLLPRFGLWPAFLALAAPYALAALALSAPRRRARRVVALPLVAGALAVLAGASPLALPAVRLQPGERVLFQSTGAGGVLAVVERDGERSIRTDNHYVLGGSADRVHQERQGHVPLLLHPDARRVVFVGSATGGSAGAAVLHPVEEIALVEIQPGVLEAGRRFFRESNRGVHDDPRARAVPDDARSFLRATRERFDVIVGDLFVPWRAGTGSLYAREHFENVRARLSPDGLFCQWLALYQLTEAEFRVIVATFLDVFPRAALFRGDFYGRFPIAALVGYAGAPAPSPRVAEAVRALAEQGVSDRWLVDPVGFWSLYAGPLGPLAAALADAPRNLDARPRIEFPAARSFAGGRRGKLEPFVGLRFASFAERLGALPDALYPDLAPEARRAARGGAALQTAGALWVAGREDDAARALAAAVSALPAGLIADAPADPTAAELWPGTGPG